MTTKHTPGPWACVDASNHAHDYRLTKPNGEPLPVNAPGNDHSEQRANARLIAAAPDLLEALEESNAALHAVLNGPLSIDHDGNRMPARLAMRDSVWNALQVNKAALAKARGEA